jgi:MFS family permease
VPTEGNSPPVYRFRRARLRHVHGDLDIQIVASSLAEIRPVFRGTAGIAWVQTSYLVAEVVMIPLSGFLARALSTRVLFTISAAGFTLASVLCATATSINEMIVYRALRAIGGGDSDGHGRGLYDLPRRSMGLVMAWNHGHAGADDRTSSAAISRTFGIGVFWSCCRGDRRDAWTLIDFEADTGC